MSERELKMPIYHYVVKSHLSKIIESGEIKLSICFEDFSRQILSVFCTSDKLLKPTIYKMVESDGRILDLLSLVSSQQLARIELNFLADFYSWGEFVSRCNINMKFVENFEKEVMKQGGNVNNFYLSFKPIKKEDWISIQVLNDERVWKEYKFEK